MSRNLVDPGVYRVRAVSVNAGINENSGNTQFVISFSILEGAFADETVRMWATLTEKTQRFVVPQLVLCGWDGSPEGNGITDNEVDVEIIHDEYQGKVNAKISRIIDP